MRRTLSVIAALATIAVMCACATSAPSTRITNTWSAPAFQPPPNFKKVFVLLVSRDHTLRATVEGAVSVEMGNIEGVPANVSIPDSDLKNIPKVQQQLEGIHVDGAVVMRLMGVGQDSTWIPDGYPTFWGYYAAVWDTGYWDNPQYMEPGYNLTKTHFQVETKVYDVKTGKQLWAAMSDAITWQDDPRTGPDVVAAANVGLRKIGLVQ